MAKKLVLDESALDELQRAIHHYEDERPGLGAELSDAVEVVFRALANDTTRPVTVPGIPSALGVRRVFVERFPFAIIHINEPDAVHIVAVAHLRKQPLYWRDRLPPPEERK